MRSAYEPLTGPGLATATAGGLPSVGGGFDSTADTLSGWGLGAFNGPAGALRFSLPGPDAKFGFPALPLTLTISSSALRFVPLSNDEACWSGGRGPGLPPLAVALLVFALEGRLGGFGGGGGAVPMDLTMSPKEFMVSIK